MDDTGIGNAGTVTSDTVREALKKVIDPVSGDNVAHAHMIKGIQIKDNTVYLTLELQWPTPSIAHETIESSAKSAILSLEGVDDVKVVLTAEKKDDEKGVGKIKHIVAILSAKGGVGKSTTAVNIALALRRHNLKVGIVDADVFGPSIPRMLRVTQTPQSIGSTLLPIDAYGIKTMSIGLLLKSDAAVIWRGPMVMRATKKLLEGVVWGDLDILIVDMPPGTGDTHLTIAKSIPLRGAIVVSTPQDIALIDARRTLSMCEKVNVNILGIVENMSTFICPHCHKKSPIFSNGGARIEAEKRHIPFLGHVPLHMDIRETSDEGLPIVATKPTSPIATTYMNIAENILTRIQ